MTNPDLEVALARATAVSQLCDVSFAKAHALSTVGIEQILTLNFLARGMTTHRAVRLLVENGLNGEAAATMRTLVELDIDLAYILLEDTKVRFQRFFEFEHVAMCRLINENPGCMPEEDEAKIRELYEAVRLHYPHPNRGWAGISIKRRANAASRSHLYVTSYALGSSASHSGIGSLKYSVGSSAETFQLFTAPREPHPALLELATRSLFRLVGSVASYLELELDDDFRRVSGFLDATLVPT